jgi:hypothetical protein
VYIYNVTQLAVNNSPSNPIAVGLTFPANSSETYEMYMQSAGGCFDVVIQNSTSAVAFTARKNVSHGYFNYSSFNVPSTDTHTLLMQTCSRSSSPSLNPRDAEFFVCAPTGPGCEDVFDCSIDLVSNYKVTCSYDFSEGAWSLLDLNPSNLTLNVTFDSNNPGMTSSDRPTYFSDQGNLYVEGASFTCSLLNCEHSINLNYKEVSLIFTPTTNIGNALKRWNEMFTMNVELSNSTGIIGNYPLTINNCSGTVCDFRFPVPISNGTYTLNASIAPRVPYGFLGITPMSYVGNFSIALEQVVSTFVTSAVEKSPNDVIAYLVYGDVRYAAIVESDKVLYFSFNPVLLRNRFIDSVVHLAGG